MLFTLTAYSQAPVTLPAYIESAATNSDTLDLGYMQLLSITFPSTFTGATVSIYHSNFLDSAFVQVADVEGVALSITATDGLTVQIHPLKTFGLRRYIYIKSASSEAAQRLLKVDKGVL